MRRTENANPREDVRSVTNRRLMRDGRGRQGHGAGESASRGQFGVKVDVALYVSKFCDGLAIVHCNVKIELEIQGPAEELYGLKMIILTYCNG